MLKCVDFDFDREVFAGAAGEADGFGEAVAAGRSGHGEVVVLEHHAVEQADAVVVAATACEGVFLQHAVAGQGLARIEQHGVALAECIGVGTCFGGDACQVLEES